MKTVDVLFRIDRGNHAMHVDLAGQRQLDENSVNPVVSGERGDFGDQHGFAGIARQTPLERGEPGRGASIGLGADIAAARRIVADQDRGEAGDEVEAFAQLRRCIGDAPAQPGGNRFAVDYACISHAALPLAAAACQILYRVRPADADNIGGSDRGSAIGPDQRCDGECG